jgi:MFS transporter, AAHS family, 4-hydroxybenzoate transporter
MTLAGIVDGKAFGAFQLKVVALCLLAQLVDGFDNQASAFVAPALAGHWHVARAVLGPVFSASAFGTLVGALMIGPIGDLLGRKTLIVISLALAALLMAATGSVTSIGELTLIRFLTGLPLGALIPGTVVVANEWSPTRGRTAMVTIMACGFALGAVLGGLLSSELLPKFGWPSVFYAGAAGTAVIAAAVQVGMPESLRFLSLRPSKKKQARIAAILRQFDPTRDPASIDTGEPSSASGGNLIGGLFTQGRAAATLLLWAAYFMNMLVLNFMTFWLPTLLAGAGLTQAAAIRTSTLFQLGGIAGVVLMGAFAGRLGALRIIVSSFLLSAVAVTLVGFLAGGGRNVAIMAAGFCIIGIQASLAAFSATLYPTVIRSTGASWAQGIGRFGSTVGPLVGGVLIGRHWGLPQLFVSIALIAVCGFALALLLASRSRVAEPMAVPARA